MIQSVQKALDLLVLVASENQPLGVRELARRSGLTVPTAQNLLKTLAASGFLCFDERERNYSMGHAAMAVAECADPVAPFRAFGHPYVARLHSELGLTVAFLMVWQGSVLVADWMDNREGVRVTPDHRVIDKPYGLATGRVLVAWHPELRTGAGCDEAVCTQVRELGYAVTEDWNGSGVYAVAAPVFDACGRVSTSLGCSTPISRLGSGEREDLLAAIRGMAREMSSALRIHSSGTGK